MKWLFTLFISLIAFASHSYSLSDVPEQKIWATIAQQSNIKVETWYSIALAESGITIQGKFVPHVFAIAVGEDNSIGQTSHEGFYPNSKKEAIDLLAQLLAEGHTNIGIGMMQVNIKANPDLVADITTLLDPVTNLKAASKVLKWCSRHKIISAILSCYSRGSATSKRGLVCSTCIRLSTKICGKRVRETAYWRINLRTITCCIKSTH